LIYITTYTITETPSRFMIIFLKEGKESLVMINRSGCFGWESGYCYSGSGA